MPGAQDWRTVGQSIMDHLRFRHPTGEAAKRYNVLQKITYLIVVFVLLPLVVLMGLAMSPWLNSLWPGWVDLVGGRQSARTLHFVAAWALVAFVLDPRVRGHHQRRVEQPALDDHGSLPRANRGASDAT